MCLSLSIGYWISLIHVTLVLAITGVTVSSWSSRGRISMFHCLPFSVAITAKSSIAGELTEVLGSLCLNELLVFLSFWVSCKNSTSVQTSKNVNLLGNKTQCEMCADVVWIAISMFAFEITCEMYWIYWFFLGIKKVWYNWFSSYLIQL